jgi:hypothetical protein
VLALREDEKDEIDDEAMSPFAAIIRAASRGYQG